MPLISLKQLVEIEGQCKAKLTTPKVMELM